MGYNTDEIIPIHYQRKAQDVQRMNGNPMLMEYRLPKHGYFVLSIAIDLARILGVKFSMEEVDVILRHDFAETVTSDLPYPLKNLSEETKAAWDVIEKAAMENSKYQSFRKYSDEEIHAVLGTGLKWWIFKFADMLELAISCAEEVEMGNKSLQVNRVQIKCAECLLKMLNDIPTPHPLGLDLIEYIKSSKYAILCPSKLEEETHL